MIKALVVEEKEVTKVIEGKERSYEVFINLGESRWVQRERRKLTVTGTCCY